MNSPYLLKDKFTSAKLPDVYVPRHTLLNMFQRGADKRIIYVAAPAGYGKTVSTQLWVKNSGRIPIWISLDEYDNTDFIFYKLFCTGISALQPKNKSMSDILASPAFASSPVEHTISLLSVFTPDDRQYAVILDDMHLLTNKQIRKSGLLVQKRLPSSFVVVILTRNEITEEYTSVTGEEKCAVITAQDLAFSKQEIQKYFNAHKHFITEEETQAVYDLTNGWPIGVNALVMSGETNLEQIGVRILEDYIKKHVWDRWDDNLKAFILKTSIADEMSPELCVRLTGCENASEILDDLHAKNSFVNKISEDTYRYHRLFLDFARSQNDETSQSIKNLHKIAAEYYMDAEEIYTARRHAMLSGDEEAIKHVIFTLLQHTKLSIDEYVNQTRMFDRQLLPEWICNKYPYLHRTHIWFYYVCGDVVKTEYYLDRLYKHLPAIERDFPEFYSSCVIIKAVDHRITMREYLEQLKQLSATTETRDNVQGMFLTVQFPFMHRGSRDFYELTDELLVKEFMNICKVFLREKTGVIEACGYSGIFFEQNKLKQALEKAADAQGQLEGIESPELIFSAHMHHAAALYSMGERKAANEAIAVMKGYIEESGAQYLLPNLVAYEIKIQLSDGNKYAARTWLNNYFVVETEQLELYKIFQHFTTARAYIVLSQTDKAMSYILRLKKLGTDYHRLLDIAEASVLQAILEWALGKKTEALDTLETALTAVQGYGFIRVIADEGAAVMPILKKLAVKLKKDNYQGSLNEYFLNEVIIAAYEQSKRSKGISLNIRPVKPVKLSKQQCYIITLLSKGYKNAEIIEITGLSIHTVKSHRAAAYAKLNVNNAMDAVIKAKELGIID